METGSAMGRRWALARPLFCGAVLWLLAAPGVSAQDGPREIQSMLERQAGKLLAAVEEGQLTAFHRACLEAPDAAEPVLARALEDRSDPERRALAAYGLTLLGGEKARDALRSAWKRTKDLGIERLLCAAMASTGRSGDVEFLIQSVRGPCIGEGWPVVESAALALGVLRSRSAMPALAACARSGAGTEAGRTCQSALEWVEQASSAEKTADVTTARDRVIAAILASGIPGAEDSLNYDEIKSRRVWRRRKDGWAVEAEPPGASERMPSVEFDVYVNSEGSRALAAVSLEFGRLHARGYTYIMRRQGAAWRVAGILSTWIS
jgi:hypothetical protein